MKTYDYMVPQFNPTDDDEEKMKHIALFLSGKFFYRKTKDGHEAFCTKCGKRSPMPYREIRIVRYAKVCPFCHRPVTVERKEEYRSHTYVMIENMFKWHGFRLDWRWDWEHGIRSTFKRCLYVSGSQEYRKDIVKSMYYNLGETKTAGWLKCRSGYYPYSEYFFSEDSCWEVERTRRQYYEGLPEIILKELKPNQVHFVRKHALSVLQIKYISMFDLHSVDELLKYNRYIQSNDPFHRSDFPCRLNVTHLDYLSRNNISVYDYRDYARQCLKLGFKLDKPKDFRHRHTLYSAMVINKEKAESDRLIRERLGDLPAPFVFEDTEIRPFSCCADIIQCGKTLHMCIGGYCNDYAEGKTDIFYMTKDGKLTGAIEVTNGKLIQARADRNADISKDPVITKWFRQLRKENNERNQRIPQATA